MGQNNKSIELMRRFNWSWFKFGIAIAICIVAGFIGRCTASYNLSNEESDYNQELLTETDTIIPYEGEPSAEHPVTRTSDAITIKEEFSVHAEVFRIVDNYCKDANRKETISLVVLSNGITILKDMKDDWRKNSLARETYSKLSGYEYECTYIKGNDLKIYAYNERDKKKIKGD